MLATVGWQENIYSPDEEEVSDSRHRELINWLVHRPLASPPLVLTLAVGQLLDVGDEAFDVGCGVRFLLEALFDFHDKVLHEPLHVLVTEDQLLALFFDLEGLGDGKEVERNR